MATSSNITEVFLVEADPYNPALPGTASVRFSTGAPNNTFNSNKYIPRLTVALAVSSEIFPDNKPGASLVGSGNLILANPDGELDYLLGYQWNGRSLTVKYANDYRTAYGSFTTVFKGTVKEILLGENEISIVLRDTSELLNRTIQSNVYAGTGGSAGSADLKNVKKPLLWGKVFSAEPVLVDAVKLIYQFNDGVMTTVHGIFDKGVALTAGANYANYAALDAVSAASIAAGTYLTCTAEGYIRLGAPSDGLLTGDITGINQTSIADIVYDIIINKGGLTSGDVDLTALATFETDTAGESGYYLQVPDVDIDQVIEELVGSVHGYWTINRAGKIVVGQFKFNTSAGTINAKEINTIKKEPSPLPNHQIEVSWKKVWAVHDDSDIAFIATLVPRGLFVIGTTYSEGDVVYMPGGAEYIFINATPTAGITPPNATYWLLLSGQYTYPDGTPLVNLQPAQAGATAGAPNGTYVGGVLSETLISNMNAVMDIGDDDKLTPVEKQIVIRLYNDIVNEYADIDTRAAALSITTTRTAWATAYSNLAAYLGALSPAWNSTTTTTTIVRSTWNTTWQAYYNAKIALEIAISEEDARRANWSGVLLRPPLLTSGSDVTVDGNMNDPSVWSLSTGSWTYETTGEGNFVGNTGVVHTVIHNPLNSALIDHNATYEASWEIWEDGTGAGGALNYTIVGCQDAAGANISGDGTYWYYPTAFEANVTRGVWQRHSARFGKGTARPFPTNAVRFSLGTIGNYSSIAGRVVRSRRVRAAVCQSEPMTAANPRYWTLHDGIAIRNAGSTAWANGARSKTSITGACEVAGYIAVDNGETFIGLSTNATPTGYTDCQAALRYEDTSDSFQIWESGSNVASITGHATGLNKELKIRYDENRYRYYIDGVEASYSSPAAAGLSHKAVVETYNPTRGITKLQFGAGRLQPVVGGNLLDAVGNIIPLDAMRNNLAMHDWWKRNATIPWTTNSGVNGIASAPTDINVPLPRAGQNELWYCYENTSNALAGGGWENGSIAPIDKTRPYRFVIPIFRGAGSGTAFWGIDGSSVCNLNTTTAATNPYFATSAALTLAKWYLFVGFVYPAGSTGHTNDTAGIYDCTTGEKVAPGTNFCWRAATSTPTTHRAYQYYATLNASQVFGKPIVNLADGTEPALREFFTDAAMLNVNQVWADIDGNGLPESYATNSDSILYNGDLLLGARGWTLTSGMILETANPGDPVPAWWRTPPSTTGEVRANNGVKIPITGARTLYFSCYTYRGAAATTFQANLYYYRADGSAASVANEQKSISPSAAGAWQKILLTYTPPSDATSVIALIYAASNAGNVYIGGMRLAPTQPAADVTSSSQVTSAMAPDKYVAADYLGTVSSDNLALVIWSPTVVQGGASIKVANQTHYTLSNTYGGTFAVSNTDGNTDKGDITISAITALEAGGMVEITVNGVPQPKLPFKVTKQLALPPTPPGGTDSESWNSGEFNLVNSTSYVAITTTKTVSLVSGQTLYGSALLDYYVSGGGGAARTMTAKWQYSVAGAGSWNDFASGVTGSAAYSHGSAGPPDYEYIEAIPGTLDLDQTKTSLGTNNYDIRIVALVSSTGRTVTPQGTALIEAKT